MKSKRHKLRLRKQVIISIPIMLFIMIISAFIYMNKKETYSSEISPYEVAATPSSELVGTKLSELEPIVNLDKMIELRQKDNTVIHYAKAYKLKIDVTLDMVHNLTNNYTDPQFLATNVIGGPTKLYSAFDSFEAGVVYFIKDFYTYPERYGTTIEAVRLEPDVIATTKTVAEDGNIYMDNGLTFEQYVGKISRLFNLDPSLVLAICYQESGIKTSGLFTNSNNIGGHRGYDGWMRFPTLEAGVISHTLTVKGLYTKFNIDASDPNNVALLSGIYVNGSYGTVADHWLGKVQYFQSVINEKDLFSINK